MEKLDLNSELLQPMKEQLEIIINRLINVCATGNKEAEITLKINLDTSEEHEYDRGIVVKTWIEPRFEYQISEKIKEVKNTSKGMLGRNYEMKISEEDSNVYVQKVNEQMSFEDMEE